MYCVELKRDEKEFWNSTFRKVLAVIDLQLEKLSSINNPSKSNTYENNDIQINSLKDIGF